MNVAPLSPATIKKWGEVCFSVKEAQDLFEAAYRASLKDMAGADWEDKFQTWEDFDLIVASVENQIRSLCLGHGMALTVCNRYFQAARASCFMGIPFKYAARFSLKKLKNAKAMMHKMPGETPQEKLAAAFDTFQSAKTTKAAEGHVQNNCGTILPYPKDGQSSAEYGVIMLTALRTHFALPMVKGLLKCKDLVALAKVVNGAVGNRRVTGNRKVA